MLVQGVDLSLIAAESSEGAAADRSPEGIHKQQLKQIVDAASQASFPFPDEARPTPVATAKATASMLSGHFDSQRPVCRPSSPFHLRPPHLSLPT